MKKKIFLFLSPLFILTGIFLGLHVWINSNPGYGALQITSRPESTVYINGRPVGKTPLCIGQADCVDPKPLPVKDYTIKLIPVDSKYSPFEEKIKIEKSVLTVLDRIFGEGATSETTNITLQKLNSKGNEISVISSPDKSDVYLDSNPVGQTPLVIKDQTVSDHELKVSKRGYKEKIVRIRTVAGYRVATIVNLGIVDQVVLDSSQTASNSADVVGSSSAQLSPVSPKKIVILSTPNGFLRVREKPSTTAKEISRVKEGEVFEVMDEQKGWYEITLSNGNKGWVSSEYAKLES